MVESITTENRILRNEKENKNKDRKVTQVKHAEAEATCKAREQTRAIRVEREENKQNTDKLEKKYEKEMKSTEERIKGAKNGNKNIRDVLAQLIFITIFRISALML